MARTMLYKPGNMITCGQFAVDYIIVDDEEVKSSIVRTKHIPVKPMDPEEAVMEMEMLGHNFFVFINANTEDFSVVYKRKDGNYALIEPEE